ncbi:hypothetical protein C1637_03565 [Chryseobacterium lactis]|uniref:Bacteriocin n=1 Tax=Chryseobacterium lactis TaxID=1241981 RepID=A0A3G6RP53_CHRLC|nr:class I lanthipeptide [Chryseobacterium lactis]AZA81664.1 hypothetical protein EG342_06960 [Chryseobacterium lactis]AZB06662.1 hypothetical protein EG341_23080 [Chryseobacterium lactis]PNW15513.1 hypothetical protein C1637_03565 [Chryseobacterium lactis]
MRKKKIIRLEINKEEILNLSHDESQKILGGENGVLTVDYGADCPVTQPANCGTGYSEDCTEEGCQSFTENMQSCDCGPDVSSQCPSANYWTCNTIRT